MSSKFSSAFVVAALLSHTVLAPLTAVAQEQDTSAQQVQKTTDSNKSVSIDSPEASENVSQDSTTQGNSQTQTENLEGAGATRGGEMSDKSKLDDDGQMKEAESDSATDASSKGSIEPIDNWMPDKNLQTVVSKTLNISVSNITKNDMLNLKKLYAKGKGISNITGLEYAHNAEYIRLEDNHISDLTPLQNLRRLSELSLNYNKISDLTPLQNMIDLMYLNLSGTQISDLTPLQNLTSLRSLYLSNNQISDLTPLQNLTSLSILDLGINQISDLTPLQNLTSLRSLYLAYNHISDLTPLQNLMSLGMLLLSNNQISDLTPLQNLTDLYYLDLSNNQISDVTPLQNLTSLDKLYLDNNQISDISSLPQSINVLGARKQSVVLPEVYVHNRKPYSISIESPIKGYTGLVPLLPQNNDTWTGVYNSGKVEWSGGNQVLERGELSSTWAIKDGNKSFSGTYTQPYILSKVTVEAHDSTLYTGDSWTAQDNFDGAKDKAGNPVNFQDVQVTGAVDTTQLGKYKVTYSYDGVQKEIEVTVLQNQTSVEAHDSTLYTGDSWTAQDNFDGAKDKAGNPVNFQDVQVTGTVDTTQPGKYKVTYSYDGVQKEIEVTVLQNQTSVEAHDSTLYTGDSWTAQDNFDGAKDKAGNPVNFQDVQVTGTVDTTQPGKYKVTYSYDGVQKEIEVTVLQNQTSVEAHDSTLYTGDSWTAQDNFDGAKDKAGNPVNFQDVQVTGAVDTTQLGKYKVTYSYDGVQKEIEVTVLQNQTSVEGHDSTLYTGDSWNAQDNFDGAKDRDGNPVNFQDVQVTGTVDTTQPGKYKITYSYDGVQKEIEVTVLQKQTSVDAHNSTLYTGDSWNAQDNFDGAKDRDGNPVNFQDVQVTGSVDTTQPGKYKVTYSYGGVQKEIEVTVLQKASKENNNTSNSGENKKNENPKTLSTNEKEKVLPSTGEKGSVWLFVSGIVFIFASVLALLRFKKKINRKNIEE